MQTTFVLATLAAVAAGQGVTSIITPPTTAPAGCSASISGKFEITAVNSTTEKRSLHKRECGADGSLTLTLADGVLKDAQDRSGYVADNYQFQFDGPPQTGAIYTAGFTVCSNGSLALGGSAVFYECLSGDFYNLYDRSWAPQCEPILIQVLPCSGADTTAAVSQAGDGQPTGTTVIPAVTQISDGQAQAASAIPIGEIGDGQPQMPTGLISQISDGQVQKPTAAPLTQIGDGQVQAPTTTFVSSATSAPVISQISDGQIQAPNSTLAAPTSASPTVVATPSPTAVLSSGNALIGSSFGAVLAGFAAILFL